MALDNWTDVTFQQFYRLGDLDQGGARVSGYTRHLLVDQWKARGQPTIFDRRRDAILAAFPIAPADRILIGGCGFGWLIESFHEAGYTNCWGVDSSPYVANNKTVQSGDITLVSDDIRGGGRVKKALRDNTGDDIFRWIITEDLVSCYADSEIDDLLNAAEAVLEPGQPTSNIIHLTVTGVIGSMDSQLNAKTIDEWDAVRPSHSWMAEGTYEVR